MEKEKKARLLSRFAALWTDDDESGWRWLKGAGREGDADDGGVVRARRRVKADTTPR